MLCSYAVLLMAACLYSLLVRMVEIQACLLLSLHNWSVVAVGKRCVYRRQLWKVAMLTGEEVYFSFHNFLQPYFGNDE